MLNTKKIKRKNIKVAVLIYDTQKLSEKKNVDECKISWVCDGLKRFILNKYNSDVFIHCWDTDNTEWKERVKLILEPKIMTCEDISIHKNDMNTYFKSCYNNSHNETEINSYNNKMEKIFHTNYSRYRAIDIFNDYYRRHDIKYTHIVLQTLDLLYLRDVEFEKLDSQYIHFPYFTLDKSKCLKIMMQQREELVKENMNMLKDSNIEINKEKIEDDDIYWKKRIDNITPELREVLIKNLGVTFFEREISELTHINFPLLNKDTGEERYYTPLLFNNLCITNYENMKEIGETYFSIYYFYRRFYPKINNIVLNENYLFYHLFKYKKSHLIKFYMANNMDICLINKLYDNNYYYLYKKCRESKIFLSESYLKYRTIIVPISEYIPDLSLENIRKAVMERKMIGKKYKNELRVEHIYDKSDVEVFEKMEDKN